jgi:hypothetical protein
MPAHQQRAEHDRGGEFDRHQTGRCFMRGAADAADKETETARRQYGAGKIEGVHSPRRMRQGLQADGDGDQAEGNVDREQPGPGSNRQNPRRDRRPQREGGRDNHRI